MTLIAAVDWQFFFFVMFALIACVFAAAVLFTSNIVRMAFYLILSLGATAGLFFLAGAEFVGAMQLMIYVGGTLVLLVFGVMLTAQSRFITMRTPSGEWVLSLVAGGSLLVLLLAAAFGVDSWRSPRTGAPLPVAEAQTATAIGAALAGVRVDKLNVDADGNEGRIERRAMSGYLLPFVIVSVHLLVVLIGAAYMARTKVIDPNAPGVAAEAPAKIRNPLLTVWMALMLLGDLAALVAILFSIEWLRSLFTSLAGAPTWLFVVAWGLAGIHAIGLLALFSWQRWGFYTVCVTGLLSGIPVAIALGVPLGLAKVAGQILLIGVLFGLLKTGGARSAWSQLEP